MGRKNKVAEAITGTVFLLLAGIGFLWILGALAGVMAMFAFFAAIVAALSFGTIIAIKLAFRSYKKRQAKRRKAAEEEAKRKYVVPDKMEARSDSPIDLLTRKAIDGNEMARDLIDTYAELEAMAAKNGESIESLRGEFTQPFKAMDELLTVHEDMKSNPSAYADPNSLDEVVLKSEAGLKQSLLDKMRAITAKNVVKAEANAAYLTHR